MAEADLVLFNDRKTLLGQGFGIAFVIDASVLYLLEVFDGLRSGGDIWDEFGKIVLEGLGIYDGEEDKVLRFL